MCMWLCGAQGWCRGMVTVIGDAAHAGLPNGQGLNLALEDGGAQAQPALHPAGCDYLIRLWLEHGFAEKAW